MDMDRVTTEGFLDIMGFERVPTGGGCRAFEKDYPDDVVRLVVHQDATDELEEDYMDEVGVSVLLYVGDNPTTLWVVHNYDHVRDVVLKAHAIAELILDTTACAKPLGI